MHPVRSGGLVLRSLGLRLIPLDRVAGHSGQLRMGALLRLGLPLEVLLWMLRMLLLLLLLTRRNTWVPILIGET